ncbi:hypothetical protein PLICRDRAFT_326411 [Plicaturopsis crispa FD-325 SS-3]|nr:hypothetical protein PLICRDRAFT_326411 [Plicaturopsis crispa FD-325 SS-3]
MRLLLLLYAWLARCPLPNTKNSRAVPCPLQSYLFFLAFSDRSHHDASPSAAPAALPSPNFRTSLRENTEMDFYMYMYCAEGISFLLGLFVLMYLVSLHISPVHCAMPPLARNVMQYAWASSRASDAGISSPSCPVRMSQAHIAAPLLRVLVQYCSPSSCH